MSKFPTIEELKIKYADILNNPDVQALSYWKLSNHGEEFNMKEYITRARKGASVYNKIVDEILEKIKL